MMMMLQRPGAMEEFRHRLGVSNQSPQQAFQGQSKLLLSMWSAGRTPLRSRSQPAGRAGDLSMFLLHTWTGVFQDRCLDWDTAGRCHRWRQAWTARMGVWCGVAAADRDVGMHVALGWSLAAGVGTSIGAGVGMCRCPEQGFVKTDKPAQSCVLS